MCSMSWLFICLGDVIISKNDPEIYSIWAKVYWQDRFQTLKPRKKASYRFNSQRWCCPLIRLLSSSSSIGADQSCSTRHWKHSLQIERQLTCWIVIITRSMGSFSKIELPLCLITEFLKWWYIFIDTPAFSFQPCHLYWIGK